jgi:hypothetical protein
MRKLWNMVRWGSAEGPEIVIDWDKRSVTMRRMPPWMTIRLMKWISYSGNSKKSVDEMARALLRVSKKSRMPIYLAGDIQDVLEEAGLLHEESESDGRNEATWR